MTSLRLLGLHLIELSVLSAILYSLIGVALRTKLKQLYLGAACFLFLFSCGLLLYAVSA